MLPVCLFNILACSENIPLLSLHDSPASQQASVAGHHDHQIASGWKALPNEETIVISVIYVRDCREMRKLGDASVFILDADNTKLVVSNNATLLGV
jgi:hypothetical protein